jgi:hypothetical protein
MDFCKKTLLDVQECLTNSKSFKIPELIIDFEDTIKKAKENRIKSTDPELVIKDRTFNHLLDHLKKNDYDNISEFIEKYNINYHHLFEPQESLFRLFAALKLFDNIKIEYENENVNVNENESNLTNLSLDFNISTGNYSSGTNIDHIINNDDTFKNFLESNLKDKGDISDLTFISKDNKIIIACSSKNFSKPHSKFDLDQINNVYLNKYNNKYKLKTIVVIPDKLELETVINRMKDSSSTMRDFLKNSYKIDWNDLNEAYIKFKSLKNHNKIEFNIYPKLELPYLSLYMNQRFSIEKATEIMKNNTSQRILLGQKPRSGKTFIMAGIISRDLTISTESNNIYIIITPVPGETKTQYKEALLYKDFESCELLDLTGKELIKFDNKKEYKKNLIILVSKQYLGYQDKKTNTTDSEESKLNKSKVDFFKNLYEQFTLKIVFFDEVHHGGTTGNAKDIYSEYKFNTCHNIMVTATYDKPIKSYNIIIDNYILWDLDDEYMCKTLEFDTETKKLRLFEKHGEEFEKIFNEYTIEKIVEQYKNAPDIKLFMMKLLPELKKFVDDNDIIDTNNIPAGFSMNALLKTNNDEFEYPDPVKKFTQMLFAKDNSMFKQIDDYCIVNESRRFTYDEPLTIMMFLPSDNVNDRSQPLKSIINIVNDEFEVVIINNKNDIENKDEFVTNNAKEIINKSLKNIIKNNTENILPKKKGVIALLGMQASIGVTIKSCDIVILADSGTNNKDMTQQRMFRCGSDGVNKKYGFVIDTNYHRVFETLGKIADSVKISSLDETVKDSVKYIIETNLLEFGNEDWIETVFSTKEISDQALIKMIYEEYLKNQQIKSILQHININEDDEKMLFLVENIKININKEKAIKNGKKSSNKGIKRLQINNVAEAQEVKDITKNEITNQEKLQRLREIVDYILPLIVLFYKGDKKLKLSEMLNELEKSNVKIYNDIIDQINRGWFKKTNNNDIQKLLMDYVKLIETPVIGSGLIDTIADLKEFFKNKLKPLKIYEAINDYVSIIETNRTTLADISTPIQLVNEMLDKIPNYVWDDPDLKWFDPAVGRGIFIIVIFNRLMDSLKIKIPNEFKRKDHILSKMLFMSEISPVNVELCKEIFKHSEVIINTFKPKYKNKLQIKLKNIVINIGMDTKYNVNAIDTNIGIDKYNVDDLELVREFLKLKLTPNIENKKNNGEVFTPEFLIEEMLDKLPKKVWSNPDLKWFDPAVGVGNFMIFVYYRLMENLKTSFPNDIERKAHIIKNMLYMSEINNVNIKECKKLFGNELNIYEGDTLKMNTFKEFGIEQFNIIVGNPPFNNSQEATGKRGGGDSLWNKFVKLSLDTWLNQNGYLVHVHPNAWRKPDSERSKNKGLYRLMTKDNTMLYLEIHNSKDGSNTFKAGTRYDWYVIEKTENNDYTTEIKDELGITSNINLNTLDFLPNYKFESLLPLLAKEGDERCPIIYSSSNYETRKSWVSSAKTDVFKYPLIHSTNISGIRYKYSSRNDNGHFNIPKVIFGESGLNDVIIDFIKDENGMTRGEYGMTQHAMAIEISSKEEGKELKNYLLSSEFQEILKTCMWGNFGIDWRLFSYFKKDFYK